MSEDHAKDEARQAIMNLEMALNELARHFPKDGLAEVLPLLLGGTAGQLEHILAQRQAHGLPTSDAALALQREVVARHDKAELLSVLDARQMPWTLNDLMRMPFGASKLRRALILRDLPWANDEAPLFPHTPAAITVALARGDTVAARLVAKSDQRQAVSEAVWWQQVLEGVACGLSMVLYDVQETWKRPKMMTMLKKRWLQAVAKGADPNQESWACGALAYLPNLQGQATTPAHVLREVGEHLVKSNHNPTRHEMSLFEDFRAMLWALPDAHNVQTWTNFMKQNATVCELTASNTTGEWKVSCQDVPERDPVLMTLLNRLFKVTTLRAVTAYLDRQPDAGVTDERLGVWLERMVEQIKASPKFGHKYALDSMKALATWLDEPAHWPGFLSSTQRARLELFAQEVRPPLDGYCALMLRKLRNPSPGANPVAPEEERQIRLGLTFAARQSIAPSVPKPRF